MAIVGKQGDMQPIQLPINAKLEQRIRFGLDKPSVEHTVGIVFMLHILNRGSLSIVPYFENKTEGFFNWLSKYELRLFSDTTFAAQQKLEKL
jgi:hypothetical protein